MSYAFSFASTWPQATQCVQLQMWYLELFDAFAILKEQYVRLQKERDNVEHQYQQLCDGWRLELEQKQAAFDQARACILSQRSTPISPHVCL